MFNSPLVRKLIALAIEEDLAFGDVTSRFSTPETSKAIGEVVAREPLVVCGMPLLTWIAEEFGTPLEIDILVEEGKWADADTVMAKMSGTTRTILALERTMLNFVQRMSGISTYTREIVNKASEGGSNQAIAVLDTRKTVPGWRILDKYATATGGARNHRMNLGDMVLLKNNHIDAAPGGNITEKFSYALGNISGLKPRWMPVEIEVRNLEELRAVLPFRPEVIMFDNMGDEQIEQGLQLISQSGVSCQVEVSGGITVERLDTLRALGVRHVSVGALTSKAPQVDISLRVSPG